MTLDVAQSAALLIMATLAIAILLRILSVVHNQTSKVKELEMRMKAMENMEVEPTDTTNDSTDTTEK